MTRFSVLRVSVVFASGLLVASACGKSGKEEKPASKGAAIEEPKEVVAEGDLEKAIAAPGNKTVTAVGSDGKTAVMEVGKTVLAETEEYIVKATLPPSATAGADGMVLIDLTPKSGWHINQDFPTKLKVTAPEGVTVTPESQGSGEAAKFNEDAAEFKVGFQAASAGDKAFTASFRFAVCTASTCDPKSADLAWKLAVQ